MAMRSSSWITQYKADTLERKDFESDSTTGVDACLATPLLVEAFILFARLSDILNDVISLRARCEQRRCITEEGIPLWELLKVVTIAHSVVAWEREWSKLLNEHGGTWMDMRFHTMSHTLAILKEYASPFFFHP